MERDSESRKQVRRILGGTGVLVALGLGILLFYAYVRPVVIFGLSDLFARAIPYQEVPPGIPGIRAADCGKCHRAIYEEWKTTQHAQAWKDPFFQAYWKKDRRIWICLNCHTPLENQQPHRVVSLPGNRVERAVLERNPRYDPSYQEEGVTCAVCHVRDGVILGPYGDTPAPHPVRKDPRLLTREVCRRCHQVPSGPFQFYRLGPCGTITEYEEGPYAREGYQCQDCHMPPVSRPLVDGGPSRPGRHHWWWGGHHLGQLKRALEVELHAEPVAIQAGATLRFTLTLINQGAGHFVPTGDPDRHLTVEFQMRNERGQVLKEQIYTIGRWILWHPVIWEVWDNRLAPRSRRDFSFRYILSSVADLQTELRLRVRVRYHILTEKAYRRLRYRHLLHREVPYVFTVYEQEIGIPTSLIRLAGPVPDLRSIP